MNITKRWMLKPGVAGVAVWCFENAKIGQRVKSGRSVGENAYFTREK
jgi:hypothetical protein